jgi:hypothetical protein
MGGGGDERSGDCIRTVVDSGQSVFCFCNVKMPTLDKNFFSGNSEPPDDIGKFEVGSFNNDIDKVLKKVRWKGQACGCIGLYLSPDNKSINKGLSL